MLDLKLASSRDASSKAHTAHSDRPARLKTPPPCPSPFRQLIAARDPRGLPLRARDLRPEFEAFIKGGLAAAGLALPDACLERARRDTTAAAARGGGGAAAAVAAAGGAARQQQQQAGGGGSGEGGGGEGEGEREAGGA